MQPSQQPTQQGSNPNPHFDDQLWIIHIRKVIEEEHENESEVPVTIFNVPKILMTLNPDSYTPQQVAIGPYHHWRPELYEMQRYKLAAAKRIQKQLQDVKFQCVVDHLTELEPIIRASYHKFLDFGNEILAWMIAIDASFLLEFLQIYAIKEGGKMTRVSSRMSHLVDFAGRKSAHNAILRDMVMLENQIPLFVLRKILEVQFNSMERADEMLLLMLSGFFKELSPLKKMKEGRKICISESAHLLDYLYEKIVPKMEEQPPPQPEKTQSLQIRGEETQEGKEGSSSSKDTNYKKAFFIQVWKIITAIFIGLKMIIKKLILSEPVKFIVKLPWKIISSLPHFKILKQPVEYFMSAAEEEIKSEHDPSNDPNKPPLAEEITIPCVSSLAKSGVRFSRTSGNISSIKFDTKTVTFYLPIVTLDVNSKVVLRNLVAYETANASGPMVFTRYTELMNGIIDTDEDVKLLRENGIIVNHMKSDKEVADLWNGMNKCIRLTKVPFLDKAIEDVNKYYNRRWTVKAEKFLKRYVFGSWQLLTLLAAVFLMLLTTLQAFCSVYGCSKYFTSIDEN